MQLAKPSRWRLNSMAAPVEATQGSVNVLKNTAAWALKLSLFDNLQVRFIIISLNMKSYLNYWQCKSSQLQYTIPPKPCSNFKACEPRAKLMLILRYIHPQRVGQQIKHKTREAVDRGTKRGRSRKRGKKDRRSDVHVQEEISEKAEVLRIKGRANYAEICRCTLTAIFCLLTFFSLEASEFPLGK